MKIGVADYFIMLLDLLTAPIRRAVVQLRYFVELGGKGGFRVTGTPGYWGRYASPAKISELSARLSGPEDDLTFCVPSDSRPKRYSRSVNIWGHEEPGMLTIEIPNVRTQCGSYERTITIEQLTDTLHQISNHCLDPESHGYKYIEY